MVQKTKLSRCYFISYLCGMNMCLGREKKKEEIILFGGSNLYWQTILQDPMTFDLNSRSGNSTEIEFYCIIPHIEGNNR